MKDTFPKRGEIWLVDLNPTRGHEQSGKRPALVVSLDLFNSGPADLVIIAPITSKKKNIPFHVQINPSESNLPEISYVKCEDIRSISKVRLIKKTGDLSIFSMKLVEDRLRILLSL